MNVSTLLKAINKDKIKGDILVTSDIEEIYAKIPEKYEDIPELPDIKGFNKLSLKDMLKFFEEAFKSEYRLNYINGYPANNWCGLLCDYCFNNIGRCEYTNMGMVCLNCNLDMCIECWLSRDKPLKITDFPNYSCDFCNSTTDVKDAKYCSKCDKSMCALCFSETSEEIALENGAKTWHKRAHALEKCREHGMKDLNTAFENKRNKCYDHKIAPIVSCVSCDKCSQTFSLPRYSTCVEKNPNLIDESFKKLVADGDNMYAMHRGYGSFLDWIPVYMDSEHNMILYNANPDAEKYSEFSMMSMDDHERCGFQSIGEKDINNLKKDLEERYDKWYDKFGQLECDWDKVYNVPIKTYLDAHGFKYHFG